MPIIRVEKWEGRDLEQKRRIARELTDALVAIIDCDPQTVRVLINDYSKDDWGSVACYSSTLSRVHHRPPRPQADARRPRRRRSASERERSTRHSCRPDATPLKDPASGFQRPSMGLAALSGAVLGQLVDVRRAHATPRLVS